MELSSKISTAIEYIKYAGIGIGLGVGTAFLIGLASNPSQVRTAYENVCVSLGIGRSEYQQIRVEPVGAWEGRKEDGSDFDLFVAIERASSKYGFTCKPKNLEGVVWNAELRREVWARVREKLFEEDFFHNGYPCMTLGGYYNKKGEFEFVCVYINGLLIDAKKQEVREFSGIQMGA